MNTLFRYPKDLLGIFTHDRSQVTSHSRKLQPECEQVPHGAPRAPHNPTNILSQRRTKTVVSIDSDSSGREQRLPGRPRKRLESYAFIDDGGDIQMASVEARVNGTAEHGEFARLKKKKHSMGSFSPIDRISNPNPPYKQPVPPWMMTNRSKSSQDVKPAPQQTLSSPTQRHYGSPLSPFRDGPDEHPDQPSAKKPRKARRESNTSIVIRSTVPESDSTENNRVNLNGREESFRTLNGMMNPRKSKASRNPRDDFRENPAYSRYFTQPVQNAIEMNRREELPVKSVHTGNNMAPVFSHNRASRDELDHDTSRETTFMFTPDPEVPLYKKFVRDDGDSGVESPDPLQESHGDTTVYSSSEQKRQPSNIASNKTSRKLDTRKGIELRLSSKDEADVPKDYWGPNKKLKKQPKQDCVQSFPLKAIFNCPHGHMGDVTLRFNNQLRTFHYSYGDGVNGSFGADDITQAEYGNVFAFLKGPSTTTGVQKPTKIHLLFASESDLFKFKSTLILNLARRGALKEMTGVSDELLEKKMNNDFKTFQHQSGAIDDKIDKLLKHTRQETCVAAPEHQSTSRSSLQASGAASRLPNSTSQEKEKIRSNMKSNNKSDEQPKKTQRLTRRTQTQNAILEEQHENRPQAILELSQPRTSGRTTRGRAQYQDEIDEARAFRQSTPAKFSKTGGLGPEWAKPLVYPIGGARRNVATVDWNDMERLDDEQFLNDNLISFGLRWFMENAPPGVSEKVYCFNTYFYGSLTKGMTGKTGVNYEAVKRWTAKLPKDDLFQYNYIIVPINQSFHWYVAIICNVHNLQFVPTVPLYGLSSSPAPDASAAGELESKYGELSLEDGTTDGLSRQARRSMTENNLFNEIVVDDSEAGVLLKQKPIRAKEPNDPIIITLDSFGHSHPDVIKNLKDYISAEAAEKRGSVVTHPPPSLAGKGIPQQANYSDCGLYLLAYIQKFLEGPEEFVKTIIAKQMTVDKDWPNFLAEKIRDDYRNLVLVEGKRQNGVALAESEILKPGQRQPLIGSRVPNVNRLLPSSSSERDKRATAALSRQLPNDGVRVVIPNSRTVAMQKEDIDLLPGIKAYGDNEEDEDMLITTAMPRVVPESPPSENPPLIRSSRLNNDGRPPTRGKEC